MGLYQHDVDKKGLTQAISESIEKVVNRVGVNLNTASASLLQYVSGLDAGRAKKIIAYREQKKGMIANREELKKVPGIGPKTFEQAAGFLRYPFHFYFFSNLWKASPSPMKVFSLVQLTCD